MFQHNHLMFRQNHHCRENIIYVAQLSRITDYARGQIENDNDVSAEPSVSLCGANSPTSLICSAVRSKTTIDVSAERSMS
jgi:hypothetical protein